MDALKNIKLDSLNLNALNNINPHAVTGLAAFGAAVAAYAALQPVQAFWQYFLRPGRLSRFKRREGEGAWAMVTGASDGIGKGFAEELAAAGFNVVLHGRNAGKLDKLAGELKRKYPAVRTRPAVLDASTFTPESMAALVRELDGLAITILVNNVGGGGYGGSGALDPMLRPHEAFNDAELDFLENINLRFPSHLTALMLPGIKRRGGPAAILNVGSGAGVIPSPYLAGYSGVKAFNMAWSRSLGLEQRATGHPEIEVLSLIVGGTENQADIGIKDFFHATARSFARSALGWLGHGALEVAPHWRHALQMWMFNSLPTSVAYPMIINITRQLKADAENLSKQK